MSSTTGISAIAYGGKPSRWKKRKTKKAVITRNKSGNDTAGRVARGR
ncbi:MAG: hypothetical protein MZV63_34475 [Marinilabiliales bacterium]|nr:hypothetical protein [Marinilabiliales bacterium]